MNNYTYVLRAWWHTPIIPALRRLRKEDHKVERPA
jgi:hypothetical protein